MKKREKKLWVSWRRVKALPDHLGHGNPGGRPSAFGGDGRHLVIPKNHGENHRNSIGTP